jgi:protein-disulfide isomerase
MSLKFSNRNSLNSDIVFRVIFLSVILSVAVNFIITKYLINKNFNDPASYIEENPMKIVDSINNYYANQEKNRNSDRLINLKENKSDVFNYSLDPYAGAKSSENVIVEFFDYNCGYCKKAFTETVIKLLKSDKNIKVVFKEMPILGKNSEIKSRISLAANLIDSSKYLNVHTRLMQVAPTINTLEKLAENIADLGFNVKDIIKKSESDEVTDIINFNRELGLELGINGTPAFIVGDDFIDGFVSADVLIKRFE